MITAASCFLWLAAALQDPEQRQGVTVPLDRALEEELTTAREFLAEGQEEAALALLQDVLEADRAAVVTTDDADLLRGAGVVARELLLSLSADSQEIRDDMVSREARTALAAALEPPNAQALLELASLYDGTHVGRQARLALEDLDRDRGFAALGMKPGQAIVLEELADLNDARLPLVESRGLRPMWRFDFRDPLIGKQSRGHRITFGDGVGYVTNGVEVVALRLGDGRVLWSFEGPAGWNEILHGEFEELSASENEDMLTIPVLADGVLLVVLREAYGIGRTDRFERRRGWTDIDVRRALPARRLYAFDAETGEMLWRTEPQWLDQQDGEPRGLVSAPPAAADGRVFLPVYDAVGTIDLSLQALDLYTGEPLWRTFVVSGQQETNLFGNILREMASQPPVARDGKVWFSTNLGAITCLEAATGRTEWTRRYARARVRTYQNGLESVRDETFANGAVGLGEDRLVVAPADSEQAFVMNRRTGALEATWHFRDARYESLRSLVGITETGAWFHGQAMVFLPFPGTVTRLRSSDTLYTRNGMASSRYPAALARGEILAPALGSVMILEPSSLNSQARLQGLGTRGFEMGPLQVAPGLAFVLRPGGVTAFSSPDAILKSLASSDWDQDAVERLLPYLEGVDLSDEVVAAKVARRAQDLAATAPTVELGERLALVAARGSFVAGDSPSALDLLSKLLESRSDARRVRAAELALDVLERSDPAARMMDRVLEILEAHPNRRVLRFDGRLERKEITVARARVLQTGKRSFGSEAHLDALLRLLMQDGIETERQGSLTLANWARLQVQSALRDPKIAARVERRARIAFEAEPASDSLMQRFAGTDTAWAWLRDKARAVGNDREAALPLASWLRGYEWPQAENTDVDWISVDLLVGAREPQPLPSSLDPLGSLDLGRASLLDFAAFDQRVIVLAQIDVDCFLIELDAEGSRRSAPFRLAESRNELKNDLRGLSFVHESGAAVILGDRWRNLPLGDEAQQDFVLPGEVDEVLRVGKLVAMLCERQDGGVVLEVRDVQTATRLLSEPLPLRADRYHTMAWVDDHLVVLQDSTDVALRVPLFLRGETEREQLITGPSAHDIDRLIPLPDGLVLPYSSRAQKLMWILRNGQETALLQRPKHDLRTFRAPTGFGWMQAPLAPTPDEEQGSVLFWNGLDESEGRSFPFRRQEVRFPQLESFSRAREDLESDRLLTIAPTESGRTELQAWRLPASGDPVVSWTLEVEDVPYERLVGRLPAPVATDEGWLLPLKLLNSRTEAPRVVLLLIRNDGTLASRLELEAPSNSSLRIQPVLGQGCAALRHESRIYLLGDQ